MDEISSVLNTFPAWPLLIPFVSIFKTTQTFMNSVPHSYLQIMILCTAYKVETLVLVFRRERRIFSSKRGVSNLREGNKRQLICKIFCNFERYIDNYEKK